MNVKKYLKKKAREDLESLRTEKDQEVLQSLKDAVVEEPPKTRRNLKWLWAVASGVAACAVAVVLIVEFVPHGGNDLDDVKYYEQNFVRTESDLTEFYGAVKDLTVNISEDQVDVRKTYDSLSGDELYYTLIIDESSDHVSYKIETRIVVNDKYEFNDFNVTEKFMTKTYPNYSISYNQTVIPYDSEMGINLVKCKAKINNTKYDIYVFNYEEYSMGNGTFLTVIDNLFDFN